MAETGSNMPLSAVFLKLRTRARLKLRSNSDTTSQTSKRSQVAGKMAYYRENVLGWLAAESVAWLAGELPEAVLGPRPSLMMARESGTSLVCQPLSACSFSIAACVSASQWPLGAPVR